MTPHHAAEIRWSVRLTPRAGVDRVDGVTDGALRCRVAAAPADGAANEALLRLLGRALDVPRSALRIVAGATARDKIVALDARHEARLAAHWPGLRR